MTRLRTAHRRLAFAVAMGGATLACTAKHEAPRVPLTQAGVAGGSAEETAAHSLLDPAAKAALDSGNSLFRKKAYTAALDRYRAAAALAPQHAAPLFGIYMVARAMNNSSMADSALVGIRLRSGPMPTAPHSFSDTALRRMHETLRHKATTG